jgi:hypothetical protein
MVKKVLGVLLALLVAGVGYLAFNPVGARPDNDFDVSVATPAYTSNPPRVLFDEAHRMDGKYAPFAKLIMNDGYVMSHYQGTFTRDGLQNGDVLVIVNASGGTNPQIFGINLPFLRKGERAAPAFTDAEIQTVVEWVREGGSLLLIADHYPFGSAAASMAAAFGVTMHGGFAEMPNQYPNQDDPGSIEFARGSGMLLDNAITNGRTLPERVIIVRSFTGQSLDGPPEAFVMLRFPVGAKEFVPPPPNFTEQPAGDAQGLALEFGEGRVVVMGEAGMLTAQIEGGKPFGMNVAKENRLLALNIMHWLSRLI